MMTNVIFHNPFSNCPGHITYVYVKSQETTPKMISLVKVNGLRLSKLKMTLPHQLKLCTSFVYTKNKIELTLMELNINICDLLY